MLKGGIRKYKNVDKTFADGKSLLWPGSSQGFPVRGKKNIRITQQEYESVYHVADFKSKVFYIHKEEDKQEFDDIQDKAANGWYVIKNRIDKWNDETNFPIIWLEWVEIYGEYNEQVNGG